MKKSLKVFAALAAFALLLPSPKAHAVSKEMIQLQVQVQALQNAVQQLQQQQQSQLQAIESMISQTAGEVSSMKQNMKQLNDQIQGQVQNGGGQIQQLSAQVQSLNNSVDNLQTKIMQLSGQVKQVESQIQNAAQSTAPSSSTPSAATQGAAPDGATAPASGADSTAAPTTQPEAAVRQPQYPPIQQLYQIAFGDFMGGRYGLSASEFATVVQDYPYEQLSGNAQFYIGEANYHQHKYREAVHAYQLVLENFPGNSKAPASRLHEAYAEIALGNQEAAMHDLKALINRYPETPEAGQARSRLRRLRAEQQN